MCMAHTLGMSIQQHQQKSLLKFYVLPRAKTSRFPEKFSEKRLKKPWVKVQVHRICQSPFWHLFVTPLKMGAKSPEVVETSRLFALISFLVQLDGGQYRTRTCDPMHVKHVLIPAELTVHQRDYYSESRWICQALFSRYHAIRRSAASP